MRALSLITLSLIIICTGCDKDEKDPKVYYESMRLIRYGGGANEFKLYPTENPDILQADVIKHHSPDSIIHVSINKNPENMSIFSSYFIAMKNETELSGDFKQSTLYTGTWVYIYLIKDSVETEVSNISLRDSLLKFERLVKDKLNNY